MTPRTPASELCFPRMRRRAPNAMSVSERIRQLSHLGETEYPGYPKHLSSLKNVVSRYYGALLAINGLGKVSRDET
jgi:hypothetical protein